MKPIEFPRRCDPIAAPEIPNKPDIAFGICLPKGILTNEEIESWAVKTSNGSLLTASSLEQKTGILKRYVADDEETPFSMAICAAREALKKQPQKNIDAVIVSTSFPTGENLSAHVQKELGISGRHLDIYAACSGFTLSLAHIKAHEGEFLGKKVLLITTEKYSPYLWDLRDGLGHDDPSLSQTIFSDGAVAVVFEYGKDMKILAYATKRFPKETEKFIEMPVDRNLLPSLPFIAVFAPKSSSGKFEQDGRNVYRLMCEAIPPLIEETVEKKAGLDPSNIKMVFPHQGSGHMVEGIAKRLPKFSLYPDFKDGNFSSASIPKALMKAIEEGRVEKGDKVVLAGFGAGLFASIAVVQL